MCYIQLSQLGLAGNVRHGNTLSNEIWEVWPTPQEKIYTSFRPESSTPVQNFHDNSAIQENHKEQFQFDLGI